MEGDSRGEKEREGGRKEVGSRRFGRGGGGVRGVGRDGDGERSRVGMKSSGAQSTHSRSAI